MYIVNHFRKHRFVSIPKVGCTTLKLITSSDDKLWNMAEQSGKSIHTLFGYEPDGKRLTLVNSEEYSDYTTMAVYRDPVSRFQSWYKDKVSCVNHPYLKMCGFVQDKSIDRCLDFLQFELGKLDPEWIEEHVRPQHLIYDLDKIDHLVKISDLSLYLQAIGLDISTTKSNSTGQSEVELSDTQRTRINTLYAGDLEIPVKLNNKIWQPSNSNVAVA